MDDIYPKYRLEGCIQRASDVVDFPLRVDQASLCLPGTAIDRWMQLSQPGQEALRTVIEDVQL